ncbi:antibiotic biosynthesis monooxygenase family protein [Algibacter miyuki]|uniref:Antibiotic biosynthesis monooxygenase family protein n=1 Tax=Algibacter miyuki TaxID=1306933 RepID=A0ABV5GW08_9FLAO|nr:antibiotic biosynthesis monooxygenase [Algibacter miyuki]MDN3665148.1 antibiotic biosynthesis monooxygenase [Algibacter miyuki]
MRELPYYAVIFTSTQKDDIAGYDAMALKMEALVKTQSGFLGMESARDEVGITVSYWENLDAIKKWKQESAHLEAQHKGREHWYSWYNVKVCKVEREYDFS